MRLFSRISAFFSRSPGLRFLALLGFAWLLPLNALAQAVRWDPPGGQLGYNQTSQLALIFEDCEPDGAPALPAVDGLQFANRPSQSSQTSIVNFKVSRTFSLIYAVRANKRVTINIPAFDIQTDKGTLKVPAAKYTVGDAPLGNSGLAVDDVASASLEAAQRSVWVGEVFPVKYTLNVMRRYYHSLGSNVEWSAAPAVADDWTKPDPAESLIQGERRVISEQNTHAVIKQPGEYTLKPAAQTVILMVGSSGFGLFTQPNLEQRQIESRPLQLTVKPLPTAPPEFGGAVGEFTFSSKVVPTSAAPGEPITWTLELSGTGNWPDISGLPQREVSNDFQVVQPKSKRTMKEGTLFEGTVSEDVVLVPTKAGTYRLPPVRFCYFDPKTGTYKTIATEPVSITVTGTAAPVPTPPGAPVQFSVTPTTPASVAQSELPPAIAPKPPESLPRDPLAGSANGFTPFALKPLIVACVAAAVAAPFLLWLVLAALRSRESDPQRRRREARTALAAVVAQLRQQPASQPASPALLTSWQSHAAALWSIPHAAPGAPLVASSVDSLAAGQSAAWTQLWAESDRALHGRDGTLPSDWTERADEALQSANVPGWNPFSLFAGRNLFPIFFVLLAVSPALLRADAGEDAYRRGDFAAARTEWTKTVAQNPADWKARHNLGLALAQENRWPEAAAQWTSAYLLNSREEATRWDLALGIQHSGLADPDLVELSRGEGAFQVARLATPAEWQLLLIAAALLFAAGLILMLLVAYRSLRGWALPVAMGATIIAVLLAGTATFSLHRYGILAHPKAVFVWEATTLHSVPTDADTQASSPLAAGSIAVVEKTFLGWSKLTFPAGQSGWVRSEALVMLYR